MQNCNTNFVKSRYASGWYENLENEVAKRTDELNKQTLKLKESQKALTFLLEDVNEVGSMVSEILESARLASEHGHLNYQEMRMGELYPIKLR